MDNCYSRKLGLGNNRAITRRRQRLTMIQIRRVSSIALWAGFALACETVVGQNNGECSDLSVMVGESATVTCVSNPSHRYLWESDRLEAVAFLSDPTSPEPQIRIPRGLGLAGTLSYYRLRLDARGRELGREEVTVKVYPSAEHTCDETNANLGEVADASWCSPLREPLVDYRPSLNSIRSFEQPYSQQLGRAGSEDALGAPVLRCTPTITVESGEAAVIACEGESGSSSSLLQYTATFDWPPYSQTAMLQAGAIDYVVTGPTTDGSVEDKRLDITVQDLVSGATATETIDVRVVNSGPAFVCQDMDMNEQERGMLQCQEVPGMRYQLLPQSERLSEYVPRGVFDTMPVITAPPVDSDQGFSVLVRAIDEESRRLIERTVNLIVQDTDGVDEAATSTPTSGILALELTCDPDYIEVFEGGPDVDLRCLPSGGEADADAYAWIWTGIRPDEAEAYNRLTPDEFKSGYAKFSPPEDVTLGADETSIEYSYSVEACRSSDDTGSSECGIDYIHILVKERPDIVVDCAPFTAIVGDPPLQVSCTAENDLSEERDYVWEWKPVDPENAAVLYDEAVFGNQWTAFFDVPAAQPELRQEFVYEVFASAENADAPAHPGILFITVEVILGELEAECLDPPLVYEGSADIELDCSLEGAEDASEVVWSWLPLGGTEDRLVKHPDGRSAPIFSVPASIPTLVKRYEYELVASADFYVDSDPELVTVEVRKLAQLLLECENTVTTHIGDAPRRLMCRASSSDENFEPQLTWVWTPEETLTETDTATPLFQVPVEQREASVEYSFLVEVSAPNYIPASADVTVTVINPNEGAAFQVAVSTSAMHLGTVVESARMAGVDPSTERGYGSLDGNAGQAGRMLITAQDSVEFELEVIEHTLLKHADVSEAAPLTLVSHWSYSTTCDRQAPEAWTARSVRATLQPSDCHMVRLGGEVNLKDAQPGTYEGAVTILLTSGISDEAYSVPVSLIVDAAPRVLSLGTGGGRFMKSVTSVSGLEHEQTVRVTPLVATLGKQRMDGVLEVVNPSIVPLEVTVKASFGYLESVTQPGNMDHARILDPMDAPVGDLSSRLLVEPNVFNLAPGERRVVRFALDGGKPRQTGRKRICGVPNGNVQSTTVFSDKFCAS